MSPPPARRSTAWADEIVSRLRLRLLKGVALALGLDDATLARQLGSAIHDALREHVRDLEQRLDRAERLITVGQLSASVAHELRNPLSVIETSAFILAEHAKNDERVQRHTRRIADQVTVASGVVSDLLDAARGIPPVASRVDVASVVRAAVALVACPPAAAVQIELPAALPAVAADDRRMRQILVNLVTNAFEAMEGKGTITIRARVEPPGVVVTVDDTGPGIAAEHLGRLFEPLFTTKQNGTGLGLALSREIARAHGGDIAVSNRAEGGARFELTLPIAAPRESVVPEVAT